ncbi:oligosaccharide flippase family protein [bacterium]|nr:oligosaccharide flippase family protein [bacterium]
MRNQISRILPSNRFIRNVSILVGGSVAGQGLIVISSPLLTRIYSPEDFGLLAIYSSLLSIIGTIASLRYQLAIPLPNSDQKAAHVVVLSLMLVFMISLLTSIIIFAVGPTILYFLNVPDFARYIWLLPLGIIALGSYQIFTYWAVRKKSFYVIAKTNLMRSACMLFVQCAGYAIGLFALLLGHLVGFIAGATTLGILIAHNDWRSFRGITLHGLIQVAKRYRRFPIYSSLGAAFNAAGAGLPPLLFAAFFSPSIAGIYMLANRVVATPLTLIGKSVADVFLSDAVDAKNENRLSLLIADIYDKLCHIAMPPVLMLMIAGPEIFGFIFGNNWRQTGEFAQWMAPWVYLVFVTSPLSMLFLVLEKQNKEMIFQGVLLIVRVVSLFVGAMFDDVIVAIALFTTTSTLCWIYFLLWISNVAGNLNREFLASTRTAFVWSVILVAPLVFLPIMDDKPTLSILLLFMTLFLITIRYIFLVKKFTDTN